MYMEDKLVNFEEILFHSPAFSQIVCAAPIISINPAVCTQSEELETRGLVPPQSSIIQKTNYEC